MKKYPKFNLAFITFLAILLSTVTSCSLFEKDEIKINKKVLIYMAANNNLSSNAHSNIAGIKEGYVPDYFGKGEGDVLLIFKHIYNQVPKLVKISKDSYGTVTEEVLMEFPEDINSADVDVFNEVVTLANTMFPAEEDGLFLWSHATGWAPEGYYRNPYTKSKLNPIVDPAAHLVKSFGEDNHQEMDIIELANAIPIKYSFIIFDACLMGGIEVAYEFKDKADYIISSPAEVLAAGFPYSKIFTHIFEETKTDLEGVAKEYFDYYNSMSDSDSRSATISLLKTSELNNLAVIVADIFAKYGDRISSINPNNIQGYFRFGRSWYYDFDHFIQSIAISEPEYLNFTESMTKLIPYKASTEGFFSGNHYYDGFMIDHYSGISSYIPLPENETLFSYYKTLSWNKAVKMIAE